MSRFFRKIAAIALAAIALSGVGALAAEYQLFARTNLTAWCIVPFDAKKRGPEERAEMLQKLGFKHFAYDYRAEHIPTFDAEIEACQKRGISIDAWWFPTELNDEGRLILRTFEKHGIRPQLWVMGGGGPVKSEEEQKARVQAEARRLRPICKAAAKIGCKVGLYNHENWFGDEDNQIAVIRELNMPNVGIVYNFHHAFADVDRFAEVFGRIKPYLLTVNLNGIVRDGDKNGRQILPIGQGDLELKWIRIVRDSGWRGPLGILNHTTTEDAEARLLDNLEGLDWIVRQLDGKTAGARPTPRSWRESAK